MNKTLLSPILFALLTASAHADTLPPPSTPVTDTPSSVAATPAAPQAAPAIDCNYHIPASQAAVDSALITTWAEKATLQSFSFVPATIQDQLDALKLCYTDQGWKGFNDALQKSGNIDSIKTQQLNVSSQADGVATINTVKDNQWKVKLPIQVVYQNDKEKVTQKLVVDVLVGRKPNGDLGVMQLIATTRAADTASPDKVEATSTPTAEPKSIQATSPTVNDTPAAPTPDNSAPAAVPKDKPATPAVP